MDSALPKPSDVPIGTLVLDRNAPISGNKPDISIAEPMILINCTSGPSSSFTATSSIKKGLFYLSFPFTQGNYYSLRSREMKVEGLEPKEYQLKDCESLHFDDSMVKKVQSWLAQDPKSASKKVYMVVGHRTMVDPKIEVHKESSKGFLVGLWTDLKAIIYRLLGIDTSEGFDLLKTKLSTEYITSKTSDSTFQATGERIWAVEYRRVRVKRCGKHFNGQRPLSSSGTWVELWKRNLEKQSDSKQPLGQSEDRAGFDLAWKNCNVVKNENKSSYSVMQLHIRLLYQNSWSQMFSRMRFVILWALWCSCSYIASANERYLRHSPSP